MPTDQGLPKRVQTRELAKVGAQWQATALFIGYNELAKKAEILYDRVYFRLFRDAAEAKMKSLGCETVVEHMKPVIIIERMPHIKFTEDDIELMRAAVKKWDEEHT